MSSTPRTSAGGLLSTRLLFLYALTVLAVAYTVMAFGMEWRVERGQIGPGFFPRLVGGAAVVGCMALLFVLFEPLGALLTSVLFLGGVLTLVNRGRHVANAILSVGVPLGLYLLFEVLLDTGLPEGLVAF